MSPVLLVGWLTRKIVPICDKSTKLGIYVDKLIMNNSRYWGNGNMPPSGHITTPHPQLAQPHPIFTKIHEEPMFFGI